MNEFTLAQGVASVRHHDQRPCQLGDLVRCVPCGRLADHPGHRPLPPHAWPLAALSAPSSKNYAQGTMEHLLIGHAGLSIVRLERTRKLIRQ